MSSCKKFCKPCYQVIILSQMAPVLLRPCGRRPGVCSPGAMTGSPSRTLLISFPLAGRPAPYNPSVPTPDAGAASNSDWPPSSPRVDDCISVGDSSRGEAAVGLLWPPWKLPGSCSLAGRWAAGLLRRVASSRDDTCALQMLLHHQRRSTNTC